MPRLDSDTGVTRVCRLPIEPAARAGVRKRVVTVQWDFALLAKLGDASAEEAERAYARSRSPLCSPEPLCVIVRFDACSTAEPAPSSKRSFFLLHQEVPAVLLREESSRR
jgi:hypothetical protein